MSEQTQNKNTNAEAIGETEAKSIFLNSKDYFHDSNKSREYHAGAGIASLFLAFAMLIPIAIFYELKMYIFSMAGIAIMMLIYNEGRDSLRLLRDLWSSVARSGHITENGQNVLHLGAEIQDVIKSHIVSETAVDINSGDFKTSKENKLLNLVRHLYNKGINHEELDTILAVHYFQDTDDQYSQHINTLEFISNVMPLWGIIGTLIDLVGLFKETDFSALDITSMMHEVGMAMQSTLFGVVFAVVFKIAASRFKKRRTAFEFDFEALMGSLKIIWHKDKAHG